MPILQASAHGNDAPTDSNTVKVNLSDFRIQISYKDLIVCFPSVIGGNHRNFIESRQGRNFESCKVYLPIHCFAFLKLNLIRQQLADRIL